MTPAEARRRFTAARVAHLATVTPAGAPHLVPVVFAAADDAVFTAVDHKPKRTSRLQRLANLAAEPRVSLLVDHYDDAAWSTLWWARADGRATVLDPASPEADRGRRLLTSRYRQYEERPIEGPVVRVDVDRWTGWSAAAG